MNGAIFTSRTKDSRTKLVVSSPGLGTLISKVSISFVQLLIACLPAPSFLEPRPPPLFLPKCRCAGKDELRQAERQYDGICRTDRRTGEKNDCTGYTVMFIYSSLGVDFRLWLLIASLARSLHIRLRQWFPSYSAPSISGPDPHPRTTQLCVFVWGDRHTGRGEGV